MPSNNIVQRKLKQVMKLNEGDGFGELALLYDAKRSASIITLEKTDLIVLDRLSFQKYITVHQDFHSLLATASPNARLENEGCPSRFPAVVLRGVPDL